MRIENSKDYLINFMPYGCAALLLGLVGGFTAMLGPAFVKDLDIAYSNTTWTALSMAISTAIFSPFMGNLCDMIGREKVLLLGLGIFLAGNILTAISFNLLFMLTARFVTGIGSAAIAPVVVSYIVTDFPQEKVAKGFALYMLISSSAVILGPTLSGYIIEASGWRTMMWVCSGISLVVLFLCFLLIKKSPSGSFASDKALSDAVLSGGNGRIGRNLFQKNFILRKAFILSILALFLTQGLMQANMTNVIVFVNYTQPDNTIISSYAISIMYVGMSLGAALIGPLADRYEPKNVLFCSFVITGIGCGLMGLFSEKTPLAILASSLGILGFGLGANGTVFMKVVLSGLPRKIVGTGTGTYGLFRDLASPFGVAILIPLFTNGVARVLEKGAGQVQAAVESIRILAMVEIICVILGIVMVVFLPKIYEEKEI